MKDSNLSSLIETDDKSLGLYVLAESPSTGKYEIGKITQGVYTTVFNVTDAGINFIHASSPIPMDVVSCFATKAKRRENPKRVFR